MNNLSPYVTSFRSHIDESLRKLRDGEIAHAIETYHDALIDLGRGLAEGLRGSSSTILPRELEALHEESASVYRAITAVQKRGSQGELA